MKDVIAVVAEVHSAVIIVGSVVLLLASAMSMWMCYGKCFQKIRENTKCMLAIFFSLYCIECFVIIAGAVLGFSFSPAPLKASMAQFKTYENTTGKQQEFGNINHVWNQLQKQVTSF